MMIKGVSEAQLKSIAREMGFKLDNVRQRGNFVGFVLRMATRTAEDPDAPYRKRGFSGRWTTAVCFHGHWKFYQRVFAVNPNAQINTKFRRWRSAADLEAHALDVGYTNVGSQMYPQSYASQCDC